MRAGPSNSAPHNIKLRSDSMNRRDIVKAQFSRAFRGYDVCEVDEFLDKLAETLDENEAEIEALKKKNAELARALKRERHEDAPKKPADGE